MLNQAEVSLRLQATVLETIARGGELEETLDQLCGLVEEVIDDGICSTMLLNDTNGELNVIAAPKAPRTLIESLNGLIPSNMAGSCGTAVFRNQAVFVSDTLNDSRWTTLRSLAEEFHIAACWSVPILAAKGTAIGSFAVSHLKQCKPTEFEKKILRTASHIAGIAIEHHRVVHALQASNRKFRDLYDGAPDMFVSISTATAKITECNQAALDVIGYPKEELIGRPFLDIYHPVSHARVQHCFEEFLETGRVRAQEFKLISKTGKSIDVSVSVSAVWNKDGEVISGRSIMRDVTEKKSIENEIRRRSEFQAFLVDLSSRLIRTRPADISGQFHHHHEQLGKRYDLDGVGMWWLEEDRQSVFSAHRWTREERAVLPNRRSSAEFPWFAEQVLAGNAVVVDDIENMHSGAALEQDFLRNFGVKSFLMIPLLVDDKVTGTYLFTALRESRVWTKETISELRLIAQNLAGAFARAEADEEIEKLKDQLQDENVYLREEVRVAHGFDEIIGDNEQLLSSLRAVEKIAPTDITVLILGETGTGKELVARAVHDLSRRRDKAMISVNCPALPADLIESELFGHEKGAFTGAQAMRKGRFELANGGTLFLDELGELPRKLQSKLLRVLQTGEFERLGGTQTLHADVRLIAATNRDLKQAVDRGDFRADLFYRINTFPINLPALRDRKEDIPLLAEHFVHKHAARLGKDITALSTSMLNEILAHHWPGNVRELESIIERSLISSSNNSVLKLTGPLVAASPMAANAVNPRTDNSGDLASINRAHIIRVLEQTEWRIAGKEGAASVLGMPPSTLRSKMKRLRIDRNFA